MGDLLERVRHFIADHGLLVDGDRVVVGVSGGADSLVLLHILVRLRESLTITIWCATLDHGIRGAAGAQDVAFVQQIGAEWGVPVIMGQADVPQIARDRGWGLEDAARRVRYAFLARAAAAVHAERIAVGHQCDDQAETVLMHLIRGSGMAGLRGMLPVTPLSTPSDESLPLVMVSDEGALHASQPECSPLVIRPLLATRRAEIDAYAAAHDLCPRHDATNRDPAYRRNRLRHEVIPLLETFNPAVVVAIGRLADVMRVDYDRLHDLWEASLARVLVAERPGVIVLDRARWGLLHQSDQRAIMRQVVGRLQAVPRDVTSAHVDAALCLAARDRQGGELSLPGDVLLRVTATTVMLSSGGALPEAIDAPALDHTPAWTFIAGDTVEQWFGAWRFSAHPLGDMAHVDAIHADPLAAVLAVPAGVPLRLRRRVPGDVFCPRGMGGHSQKLKHTLNAMRVPAHWRDRVPLLVAGDAIAWFVAPTADGLRGRVSEQVAGRDAAGCDLPMMVVSWSRQV